jgi:hypothetical protein
MSFFALASFQCTSILPLSFHTIHPPHPSPASLGPAEARQAIQDQTQTNLVNLRRTIYLTIMSALDFEEAGHKLLKMVGCRGWQGLRWGQRGCLVGEK